ncbi:hypothetical protein HMPREF2728_06270 [Streptococcus sp. HMSC061D10]|nr:hypothetical protein HMPREF2728_06270 [Streptococcus sp. HMSC061D10]
MKKSLFGFSVFYGVTLNVLSPFLKKPVIFLNELGNCLLIKRLHDIMYVKKLSIYRILLMHYPLSYHIRRKSV